jgi:hypothetical protein
MVVAQQRVYMSQYFLSFLLRYAFSVQLVYHSQTSYNAGFVYEIWKRL